MTEEKAGKIMALTRKFLKALGIEEDKIEEIIEAHSETVTALKEERDVYKIDAEKVQEMQERLNQAESEDYKDKFDALEKEFKDYKAEISEKEILANKTRLYKELLVSVGIPEKRHEAICRVTNLGDLSLAADGKLNKEEEIVEQIKTEWADFVTDTKEQGVDTPTPEGAGGGSTFADMSLADKMAYANEHPNSAEVTAWLGN